MKKTLTLILALTVLNVNGQEADHSRIAIKFSPTQLMVGEINFSYEQAIAQQSSFEIGIGPTVSEIGVVPVIEEINFGSSTITGTPSTAESDLGFLASVAFKYYPIVNLATAPKGFYIGPELKYRKYNTLYVDNLYGLGNKKGSFNQMQFRFNVGYQFWMGKKFALDLFTAVGVGMSNITRHYAYSYYVDGSNTLAYSWQSNSDRNVSINASFGIKLGIGVGRTNE